jgi:hypothetical protein
VPVKYSMTDRVIYIVYSNCMYYVVFAYILHLLLLDVTPSYSDASLCQLLHYICLCFCRVYCYLVFIFCSISNIKPWDSLYISFMQPFPACPIYLARIYRNVAIFYILYVFLLSDIKWSTCLSHVFQWATHAFYVMYAFFSYQSVCA